MRLDGQQKKLAVAMALVFCIAIGALVFFDSEYADERRIQVLILSTSTPKAGITSDGWWNSIPTDPSLPIMPASGISTLTPTVTLAPSETPISTFTSIR